METQETSPASVEQSNQMDSGAMRQMAEMQAHAFVEIVSLHVDRFSGIMVSNGVSFQRKLQAAKALKEAIVFSLDFGLNVTNAAIRNGGMSLARETNELAAVLVKAFDNRMLLLADNMRKEQELNETEEPKLENQGEQ